MPTKTKVAAKPQLPVLSQRELEDISRKIEGERALQSEAEGTVVGEKLPDAKLRARDAGVEFDNSAVAKRINRLEKAREAMDPANQRLTGSERQKAEKRYAELKAWLPERMLTREEMDFFPSPGDHQKDQAYHQATRKACDFTNGEHSPEFVNRATEWKRLGRLLWPEDPDLSNLETIRPNGQTSGRHFRK